MASEVTLLKSKKNQTTSPRKLMLERKKDRSLDLCNSDQSTVPEEGMVD